MTRARVVFCAAGTPGMVYDREGHFLDTWGRGQFSYSNHRHNRASGEIAVMVDARTHTVGR